MRILFVEDFPPLARFGAGLPRARARVASQFSREALDQAVREVLAVAG